MRGINMSKYTSEVRYICESYAGLTESTGYISTKNVIANARPKIFDFDYPIFDDSYRSVLETKILKHFYTREIGAESVGLWKLWLDTKLNEIMPYYNKLYESELIKFNPLYEIDITRDYIRKNDGEENGERETNETTTNSANVNSSSTSNDDYESWNKYSDTPQGGITGLAEMNYLTNATNVTQNNDNTSSEETISSETGTRRNTDTNKNTIDNTEDYLEHVKGKNSGTSYSKLLSDYRQTFLNIDMQVINDLNDLFMNLW